MSPQLGPLLSNGGLTDTRWPAATSPLTGWVPNVACSEPLEQRGAPRPQGAHCEAGAVELPEPSSRVGLVAGASSIGFLIGRRPTPSDSWGG